MLSCIWDLDGTLLDSYPVIVAAAKKAAEDAGVQDPETKVLQAVKQGSLFEYLNDVASHGSLPFWELREKYRCYTHEMDDTIPLMEGALETLDLLKQAGAVHYVFTHRGDSSMPILTRLGIADYFREVVTASTGFRPKPSGEGVRYLVDKYRLDPQATWYIGDRALDVLCAKDAGVRAALLLPEDSFVIPTGREDRVVSRLTELCSPE